MQTFGLFIEVTAEAPTNKVNNDSALLTRPCEPSHTMAADNEAAKWNSAIKL